MQRELIWKAIYNDDTFLFQYNEDGTEHKYFDIDRRKLVRFELYNRNNILVYAVNLLDNQKLIFRRRTLVHIGVANDEETRDIIYLIGWQKRIDTPEGPRNVTAINYLNMTTGVIELDDTRDNLELVHSEI